VVFEPNPLEGFGSQAKAIIKEGNRKGCPLFCIYENLAIVARFRGALAVSVVRNNKKAPNVLQYR
jgi:hypothetical protein